MQNADNGQPFINNEFREASSGGRFEVASPADESVLGSAAEATLADVTDATADRHDVVHRLTFRYAGDSALAYGVQHLGGGTVGLAAMGLPDHGAVHRHVTS